LRDQVNAYSSARRQQQLANSAAGFAGELQGTLVALAFERDVSMQITRNASALLCPQSGFQLTSPPGVSGSALETITFPEVRERWVVRAARAGSADWEQACASLFVNGTTMLPAAMLNASRACFSGQLAATPAVLVDGPVAAIQTHLSQRIGPMVRSLRALVDASDACESVTIATVALNRLTTDVAAMLQLVHATHDPGAADGLALSGTAGSSYGLQSMALELVVLSAAAGYQAVPLFQAADLAASADESARYANTSFAVFVGKIAPIDRVRLMVTVPRLDVLARRLLPIIPLDGLASLSLSNSSQAATQLSAAPQGQVTVALEPLATFLGLINRLVPYTAMTSNATLVSQQLGVNTSTWLQASATAVRSCRSLSTMYLNDVMRDAAQAQDAATRHLAFSILLAVLLLVLLYALTVVCYSEWIRRSYLLQAADAAAKSQTVRYLSHEARGCSSAALLAAGLLEEAIRERTGAFGAGAGPAGSPAEAVTSRARSPSATDKLELVATIKDALQQQIHVFSDALDWEKISSGSFTLEMQPTPAVDNVLAVVRMMVRPNVAQCERERLRALLWLAVLCRSIPLVTLTPLAALCSLLTRYCNTRPPACRRPLPLPRACA
jgi:signal transduction histidine kinase